MTMDTSFLSNANIRKAPGSYLPASLNPHAYQSLNDVLALATKKFADRPAFTSVGRTLTYRELGEKSDAFAAYLQHETDLMPGDRIAVQLPNIIQYPVVLFGAMKAGLIIVNTNPLYTPKELEHQFNDAGVKALVVFANMAHNVEKILAKTSIKHVIITEIADFHPPLKRLLVNSVVKYVKKMVPEYHISGALTLNDALSKGKGKPVEKVECNPENIAVLQYTGGTTGVAKGAMLTHANLIANMYQLSSRLSSIIADTNEVYIAPLPLYHIYAFLIHGLTLLERGAHSVLIPNPRDLPGFVKELKKWPFTGFVGLNTLFVGLCNKAEFKALDFSTLKLTCSGGMPLTHAAADEWERITGCKIVEGYGLTETSPVVSFNPIGKERIGTIGLPVSETDIKIQGRDGETLPQGESGMLCVRGPQVMKGYWNREEATREVMTEDGFLITGDIAMQHPDGYLQIVDRAKDMIIVSGFNVYPTEVEDCLSSHPSILESAAIGVPDDKTGESVKAFVVLRANVETLDEKALRIYCKENLAAYKVPKFVEIRKELPKTNVGKVLRRALREQEQA
ncbi:MAG: AMP-binding protein [Gammaproteobacteria bacterium]|uniref:AMP-binding protein n=1 Tax=Marinomonas sp. ef1 TaxID=2005043 RepID=UPI000C289370|nr:AMP-binding protein [Marinomonas sp. ef1]MBU1296585.1 AMP-binding protein [Gammaproteobacteria bacterium]MBU1468499.1 AMP-binding protein [Gammaproteobacteria bacterium]MBU2024858.1 AMP-binding protein [Gammaproteobacteria bacterium]MBU2237619.1 AMP-binding protein [Gammaproteobacteria bacterium]MBU2319724.1 AMP-binding protein [Gammaproteobacteria bacterium]